MVVSERNVSSSVINFIVVFRASSESLSIYLVHQLGLALPSIYSCKYITFANSSLSGSSIFFEVNHLEELLLSLLLFHKLGRNRSCRVFFHYFDVDDYKYWTMSSSIEETILINRALK